MRPVMRCNTFARSALFAAVAAALSIPWMITAPIALGAAGAFKVYLVVASAAYLAGLAATMRGRLGAGLTAAIAASAVALVAGSLSELLIGVAVVLATARSGFLLRRAPARAVGIEAVLGLSAVVFARFLAGASVPSTALALWGFFLVQSLYFLLAGARARAGCGSHADPFEAAHARALALLDS